MNTTITLNHNISLANFTRSVSKNVKPSVARSALNQLSSLQSKINKLTRTLKSLNHSALSWIKNFSAIRKVKNELRVATQNRDSWIRSIQLFCEARGIFL